MNKHDYPEKVCYDCGANAEGSYKATYSSTYHEAKCDVCGKLKPVTQPRDFGYPKFTKTKEEFVQFYKVETTKFSLNILNEKGYVIANVFHNSPEDYAVAKMLAAAPLLHYELSNIIDYYNKPEADAKILRFRIRQGEKALRYAIK